MPESFRAMARRPAAKRSASERDKLPSVGVGLAKTSEARSTRTTSAGRLQQHATRRTLSQNSKKVLAQSALALGVRHCCRRLPLRPTATTRALPAVAAQPPHCPPQAKGDKSVAVLAFENLSGDKDNEYFSDGITGDLGLPG